MKLTDKCLKDFLEYLKNYCCEYEESNRGVFLWFGNETDLLHKDCKLFLNALIIEFFDSKNIFIEVSGIFYQGVEPVFNYNIQEKGTLNGFNGEVFNSRQRATEQAIIKANEIYNAV